ncbi:uncharacterized protein [Rutidosis leptorrhynchoides]|uniref:uncharacterized protein n=1 Tax=Rutidosis leptorrhynchoides TaxID=125765 RepID=UPI003A998278
MLGDEFTHQSTLGTWKNIVMTGTTLEDFQVPFKSSFVKTIGNGDSTSFWNEQWCNRGKLCDVFPRLCRLDRNKEATFRDRVAKENGELIMKLDWVRDISGRVLGNLDQIATLVSAVNFDESKTDSWSWSFSNKGFEVKQLTSIIEEKILGNTTNIIPTIRNNLIPKKIEIFMWRALKKRLPVHVELDKRGIDLNSTRCPLCDGDLETVDHTLIFCNHALDVWMRIYRWWGMGNFNNFSISEIANEDINVPSSSRGSKVWQAVKWACAYYIWKNRNNKIFKGKNWSGPVALSEIQIASFVWISNRLKGKKLEWLVWLSNPNIYLSIL